MKKLILILTVLIMSGLSFAQNNLPFSKGVNLFDFFTTWNQSDKLPDMYRYDEADFICMKSMGIDVIRLAICFDYQMEPEYTGKIKEAVLQKLDEVCDWAEKYQIYLIIDNHSLGSEERWDKIKPKDVEEHLQSVWSQVAPRYKDRSDYIIYEIQNEPGFRTGTDWNKIQQKMIDLIRKYDTKHSIIVSPQNYGQVADLTKFKPYKDPNLIYSFHFYEPMIFVHQGEGRADFAEGVFGKMTGIPFPYDREKMPSVPSGIPDYDWYKYLYEQYSQEGTEKHIKSLIKKAADWGKKYNVRLFCGEIGAGVTIDVSSRAAWNKAVTGALKEYNIPYCVWGLDYACGFLDFSSTGIEEPGRIFPDDISKDIVESYGFSMPDADAVSKTSMTLFPQKPYIVYDGIVGKYAGFSRFGEIELVNEDDSHGYCIKGKYSGQSGAIFVPPKKIISSFVKDNASLCISVSVKFTDKNQILRVHLCDTDEGAELPPWQNSYIVKASDYKTGDWVTVEIPVSKFKESGAWSDKVSRWFDPQGKFDWSRFERIFIEVKSENDLMKGDIYIDDIVIKKK